MMENSTTATRARTGHGRGSSSAHGPHRGGTAREQRKGRGREGGRGANRRDLPRPEYDHKLLNIRRVTRVVAGGRRFNFSVAVAIGNRKGAVGVGLGKAGDTSAAIEKAERNARKHLVRIPLTQSFSISHDVSAKYNAAQITIVPAPGRGLVAGSAVRSVLELAGVTDVTAKILSRSKNRLNNARAAVKALEGLKSSTKKSTPLERKNEKRPEVEE